MDRLKTDSEHTSRWNTGQPHWNHVGLTNIYIALTLNMTNRLQTQIAARCVRVARFLSVHGPMGGQLLCRKPCPASKCRTQKTRFSSGFLAFLKLLATAVNSMGFFRGRHPGFTQAFGVVFTRRRGRNSPGLGDTASVLGVGDA
jgi:hypothetical protein